MDPIVIALATAVGALVGTSVGVLLLRRKLRPPVTDAEYTELKSKLQTGEAGLAAAKSNLDDLRKQITLQEKALLQNAEDLKKKQEQLDAASAETQKEKAQRTTAEKTLQELGATAALLSEQCTKLEARAREEEKVAAERAAHLAFVESDLEAGKQKIQELTEQSARLAAESEEHKRSTEQETRFRAALEAQMKADQERIGQLTAQVAELQGERLQLEIRLKDERGSAAKGMELLLAAQEKLSSVFKALGADAANGHHNPPPVEAAAETPEVKTEAAKAQASSSPS